LTSTHRFVLVGAAQIYVVVFQTERTDDFSGRAIGDPEESRDEGGVIGLDTTLVVQAEGHAHGGEDAVTDPDFLVGGSGLE
jgi:hypothetical protein